MKKIIYVVTTFLILLCITGCGSTSEKNVVKNLKKKINKADTYKINGTLEITNNEDTYQYDVEINYKRNEKYKVSLKNKSNNHEQIILKNTEGVYVVTPSLNKSFKFQSDWPNNNSQIYLLKSILNDIEKDKNMTLKTKKDSHIITTKVNYPNNSELVKQKIELDKNYNVKKVEVMNSNDITQMIMMFDKIKYNCNIDDNIFNIDKIIDNSKEYESEKLDDESQNEEESKETSTIEDVIYPLYIPTGTSLQDQERVSKTNGERIILTFDGEKPFLLVEETSEIEDEFNIIPTFGEPFLLTDTIGALGDNSITWSSNGIDYYIVSETMSQQELIEIASSITAIPTIK